MLEKIGVASLAVGLFQQRSLGLAIAAVCLLMSLLFTVEEDEI